MSMVSESLAAAKDSVDHAALAETMPLDEIDVSNPSLYQQDVWQPYFRPLRREAPVHYCKESPVGPFWSVTKHKPQDVLVEFCARRNNFARPADRA